MYVNERRKELSTAISQALLWHGLDENDIHWVSPLAEESYAEYRDSEFLERVGLDRLVPQLQEFWPRGGPCWDALARIQGGCILVESKSHISEIYGSGCKVTPENMEKIDDALEKTQEWLGVPPEANWTKRLYQSANRYASLYFLREIAGVRAFLINVYFLDDPTGRTSRKEWDVAIDGVRRELRLDRKVPYSANVFLKAE